MAYPAGMQTVRVTAGPILNPDGSPVTRGTIRLRPAWELIHDPSGTRVIRTTADITLTDSGTGVTDVPASDASGLRRPGVRYWVSYELALGMDTPEPHWAYFPADRPNARLEDMVPVDGPGGTTYVPAVVSVAGLTGAVTVEQLIAAGLGGGGTATPDATATVKGKLRLAGDLAGSADSPSVPALADKANTVALTAGLASARDRSTHTGTQPASTVSGLATVATTGAYGDLSGRPTLTPAALGAELAISRTGATAGQVPVLQAGGALAFATPAAGSGSALTPTTGAAKTAPYAVAIGELAVMNVPAGGNQLTLPSAPQDKAQAGFWAINATTAAPLTIVCSGADTIGNAGATTVVEPLANSVRVYQYDAPRARWFPATDVKTLTALKGAFLPLWTPGETVLAGDRRVAPDGTTVRRVADGVTGAAYDAAQWAPTMPTWTTPPTSWHQVWPGVNGTTTPAQGVQAFWPFVLPGDLPTGTQRLEISTASGVSTAVVKAGVYLGALGTGLPDFGTLIDFGSLGANTTGVKDLSRAIATLPRHRLLWLSLLSVDGAPTLRGAATPGNFVPFPLPAGVTPPSSGLTWGLATSGGKTDLATSTTPLSFHQGGPPRASFRNDSP